MVEVFRRVRRIFVDGMVGEDERAERVEKKRGRAWRKAFHRLDLGMPREVDSTKMWVGGTG